MTDNGDDTPEGDDERVKPDPDKPSIEDLAKLVFGEPGKATDDAVEDIKAGKDPAGFDSFLSAILTQTDDDVNCIICGALVECQQCGGTGHWPKVPEVPCMHCKGFGTCPHNR